MKSPYLCNPNILAHPDRLVQSVALDMTAQDCYLAGSPISAEGKLANDATAIGILLYDVHKQIGGTTGVVVISGRIQQDVAAEHSGVTISADCKAALIDVTFTGDGCRMGGGGLTELPEGYPYKTGMTIEWDGNTEGLYSLGGTMFRVSDAIISNDDLKNSIVTMNNGGSMNVKDMWGQLESMGMVTEDCVFADAVMVARKDNCELTTPGGTTTIEKAGVYFLRYSASQYVASLTFGEVHPMAEEFMPLLTSPNGTKYKLTVSDDGTLSAVAVS